MTGKSLNTSAHGHFQDNPHKLLRAVLENSNNHVVDPDLLTLKDTSIYLCPKNDEEDRYEIKAFCHSKWSDVTVTLLVSKSIQTGFVRWETPPEAKIIGRGQGVTIVDPEPKRAEEEAHDTALEYWKWGEKPPDALFAPPTEGLCHYKRDYLTDYFNRMPD
nr:MAG TPA: hypothetical protein [Siphoviridae sp. ctcOR4]